MLYEYDRAAWHGTDAVRALDPPKESVGRYIAQKTDSGWKVIFGHLNASGDKFLTAYEAMPTADPTKFTVNTLNPPHEDTGFAVAAAHAIDTALSDFGKTNRPYNVAVFAIPDALVVYVYPAQIKPDVYPLGGDVRYLTSADGLKIENRRQMHKSILERGPGDAPPGVTLVAGYHTAILDNIPEDTDVFLVLTRKPSMPETIITPRKYFYEIATDGRICFWPDGDTFQKDKHNPCASKAPSSTSSSIPGEPPVVSWTSAGAYKHLAKQQIPVYPKKAKDSRVQGTVKLLVRIGTDGSVKSVTVLEGPKELVDSAVDAVKQWKYEPATMPDGSPAEAEFPLNVNFELQGG